MLTAKEVQALIGVEDLAIIAHGYTFERDTVDLWFQNGKLVRHDYKPDGRWGDKTVAEGGTEVFTPTYFQGIKRWYRDQTNPRLIELFETFGNPLPMYPAQES